MQHKKLWTLVTLFVVVSMLVSCTPQVIKETVVVKETVIVEKPVEKVVKETVVVEGTPQIIEKVVTATPEPKPAGVDWKAYEGTEIRVILNQHPFADAVDVLLPGFEEATGIKVNVEVFPEDKYREKVRIELLAGNKDLDVFMSFLAQEGELYQEAGWYTDLTPLLADPELTDEDFDWPGDYPDVCLQGSKIQGVHVILPLDRLLPPIVYYRKDLFEEYGIPTPETLDDLADAAKIIYEGSGGEIYGMTNRGKGANATSQFRHALHEFGAAYNDETGRPSVNTPEAIAAFEWWGGLLWKYGPPGSIQYNWYEVNTEFLQGKAAISLEGALNAKVCENPETSKVVGKVGYLPMLPGPNGGDAVRNYPTQKMLFMGLAISSMSEKQEAAWLFVQWMTNKEGGLQYLLTGKQSARKSAWEDERFLSTTNPEWARAMIEASKYSYATPCYCPCSIRDVAQARDMIGKVIVSAILGEDVKAAADQAQEELVALWEKEQAEAQ